jgi:hypothetical protein
LVFLLEVEWARDAVLILSTSPFPRTASRTRRAPLGDAFRRIFVNGCPFPALWRTVGITR